MSTTSSAARAQIQQREMDDEDKRRNSLKNAIESDDENDEEDEDEEKKGADENPGVDMFNTPTAKNTPETASGRTDTTTTPGSPPVATSGGKNRFANSLKGKKVSGTFNRGGQGKAPAPIQPRAAPEIFGNFQGAGRGIGHGDAPGPSKQPESNPSKYTVEGSNIGSTAREPEWTNDQLQLIAKLKSMRLNTTLMSETRRSTRDPAGKYVGMANEGSITAKTSAWLGNIPWNEFKIGMGRPKPDEKTGKGKIYSDIVMRGNDWVLNQWTMNGVVMEGVPEHILDKPPRMIGGRAERRIGHDFVRLGLPALAVGPVLETIRGGMPNVMSSMSVTNGYYWVNASWGVTGNPGKYVYKDAAGIMQTTFKAYDAMKMIMGSSSMGVATIAISVGNNTKMQDGKLLPIAGEEEFSIKIHNMLHLSKVKYSSPPQSAANGFDVSDEIYNMAESLSMPSGMNGMFSQTASAFGDSTMNPFANVSSSVGSGTIGNQGQSGLNLL